MTPGLPNAKYEHVYAILRADEPTASPITAIKDAVVVKKVVRSQEEAEREVARLNRLNAGKGCEYFYQVTRFEAEPADAGSPAAEPADIPAGKVE
jgi:hypothetical protein